MKKSPDLFTILYRPLFVGFKSSLNHHLIIMKSVVVFVDIKLSVIVVVNFMTCQLYNHLLLLSTYDLLSTI